MATRRQVKFSLQYKITILIYSLLIISLAAIVSYYMAMNWSNGKKEMTNSVKKVTKNMGALWSVAKQNGVINWNVYRDYMNGFVQVEKNVIAMAIIDPSGRVRASAINDAVVKKYYRDFKPGADKNETVKMLLEQQLKDAYKVQGNLRIIDRAEAEKAKAAAGGAAGGSKEKAAAAA
ncbi:MAG: hypothetical protein LLG37_06085, partial [Spirochaetia bacterium]|nr:hypothetical protein [Spirochaetia bacterium]